MPWLSIIIPLYNCEPYIAMCLDSVLQQGLEEDEYEVIVVNDGSTDNGAKIVAEYCKDHTNFRLINKENGGVSSARNRGMDEAKGQYVFFMDADDRLLPKGLRILYDCYLRESSHFDMVVFRAYMVDRYYDTKKYEHIRQHKVFFQGSFLDYVKTYGFGWAVWCRLISREFLVSQGIRFESISYCEDVLFVNKCLVVEDGVVLATSLDIYRYYLREGNASTTRSKKRLEKQYYDLMELYKRIKQLAQKAPKYKQELFENMNVCRMNAFFRLAYGAFPYKQTYEMLQKAKEEEFFPIVPSTTRWHRVINFLVRSPLAIYLLSIPTRYIFLPYIRPRLHRN